MVVFASREIWKVHVCPVGAGHVIEIGPNQDALAEQPTVPHLAVALCLLTTKVVLARVSLLITVWAVAAGVGNSNAATKATLATISNMLGNLIFVPPAEFVGRGSGRDCTTRLSPLRSPQAHNALQHFFTKGTYFHLSQLAKSGYSYVRSAIP